MAKKSGGADVLVKIGGDITEFQNSLGGLLSSVQASVAKMNPVVALASAAVLGIGTSALAVAQDYEEASNIIHVATGATGAALKGLEEDFRQVFLQVPQDAKTVSEAIGEINTRLGLSGEPLQKLAKQFLDLSDLTGGDVTSTIREVTRLFGDWGVATENQSKTLDFLYRVSQTTGAGVDALAAQMVQFGAPLRQMGFDMETTALTLGKFEREGVNAELVMGSMRIALTRMAKEGVTDSGAALEILTQQIKDAGSAGEANALAVQLFGSRAGPDMAAAIREGRFEIDGMVESLGDYEGAIEAADNQTETLGERFGVLWKHIQDLLEPIGRLILVIGETLVGSMESAMRGAEHWAVALKSIATLDFKGLSEYNTKVAESEAAQKKAKEEAAKFASGLADQGLATHNLTEKHKTHKTELDKLPPAFRTSTAESKKLKDEQRKLEKQQEKTEAQTKKFKTTVEKIEAETKAKAAAKELKEEHERLEREIRATEKGLEDFNRDLLASASASDAFTLNLPEMGSALARIVPILDDVELAAMASEKAMKDMGITPKAELDALARNAEDNFLKIKNGGVATPQEIDKAWVLMMTARKTALETAGLELPAEEQRMLDKMLAAQEDHKTKSTGADGVFAKWAEGVKSITGTLGTDSLKALFSGDGFGGIVDKLTSIKDSFQDIFITKIGGILDTFITNNLGKLMGKFDDLLAKIPGLGGLGDIFGSGAGAAGQVAGAAGGAGQMAGSASSAGGAASSAASGAASTFGSVMNIVGGIGSAVSAVTDVLGMFGIGRSGEMDRFNIIANNTSYLAWAFSIGGLHDAILKLENWANISVTTWLPSLNDKLQAINWNTEQLIDSAHLGALIEDMDKVAGALPAFHDVLQGIRSPLVDMRDTIIGSIPMKLDMIANARPVVIIRNYLDGKEISSLVQADIEYGTRLATA